MKKFVLVPVEPTHNMILAGSLDSRMTPAMADSSYRAMLAASPQPDVRPVAEIVEQDIKYCGYARAIKHLTPVETKDDLLPVGTKLYLHPPAAAVQDLVASLMIIAGKQRCVDSLMSNVDIALEALKRWEGK